MTTAAEITASWKAGTLRREEMVTLVEPLLKLTRRCLRRGRTDEASDYLELLMLAVPTSKPAMLLRADLASLQGQSLRAKTCQEMAQWM